MHTPKHDYSSKILLLIATT